MGVRSDPAICLDSSPVAHGFAGVTLRVGRLGVSALETDRVPAIVLSSAGIGRDQGGDRRLPPEPIASAFRVADRLRRRSGRITAIIAKVKSKGYCTRANTSST